jgi:hypothetical protein
VRTIVCCQASWDVSSFASASLGDDGWSQIAGTTSLQKLHALDPHRVVLSHDAEEWQRQG